MCHMLLDKPFTRNMRHFGKYTKCKMKVKSPYFTSAAARNSHLNNNIDADGALNFPSTTPPPSPPSLSIITPFYGYRKLFQATRKGKKSKETIEVTRRNRTRDHLPHRRLISFGFWETAHLPHP